MQTYAEYLNTMTVKTLHAICKAGGYKGYSKLRKAELIAFIEGEVLIDWDGAVQVKVAPVFLDVDKAQDAPAIMAETVAKAPEMPATVSESDEAHTDEAEDLIYAYRAMRATLRTARGKLHSRIAARLRGMSAALKSLGVDMRTV